MGNCRPNRRPAASRRPENVRFVHAEKLEQRSQISHERSTILFRAALRSVVTSARIGDDAIAGFRKGGLLVLPDLAALRGWMAQNQWLSIPSRIPITKL